MKGKGSALGLPPLGLAAPVTAQLETGDRAACFAATLTPQKNIARTFRGRGQ